MIQWPSQQIQLIIKSNADYCFSYLLMNHYMQTEFSTDYSLIHYFQIMTRKYSGCDRLAEGAHFSMEPDFTSDILEVWQVFFFLFQFVLFNVLWARILFVASYNASLFFFSISIYNLFILNDCFHITMTEPRFQSVYLTWSYFWCFRCLSLLCSWFVWFQCKFVLLGYFII